MEIYNIGVEEQLKILRQVTTPIKNIDNSTANVAQKMIDTMVKGRGIGLAGPQVGLLDRIFTVQIGNDDPLVFINPEIMATSPELSSYEEGCLSIPEQYGQIERPMAVQVQAWNPKGRPFTIEASGLLATVIQHEIDHLNGILFIDYLSERKRNKILSKAGINPDRYPEIQ